MFGLDIAIRPPTSKLPVDNTERLSALRTLHKADDAVSFISLEAGSIRDLLQHSDLEFAAKTSSQLVVFEEVQSLLQKHVVPSVAEDLSPTNSTKIRITENTLKILLDDYALIIITADKL